VNFFTKLWILLFARWFEVHFYCFS
jgi:hypothetical protein